MRTATSVLLGTLLLSAACAKRRDEFSAKGVPSDRAAGAAAVASPGQPSADHRDSGEGYKDYGKNPWVRTANDRLSTFAADVDTASYTLARRKLNDGSLPVAAAVRVEEFVNYFDYAFPPATGTTPFSVVIDAAPSPLSPGRHILRAAVGTASAAKSQRTPANLVFLVDVSGSMAGPDRIGLAQASLRILTENLEANDTVSLVTYAGSTRVVLEPTGMAQRDRIFAAIDELTAGGSTGMASGIDLAYERAVRGVGRGAISRVIVLSDGDANVGAHTHQEILSIIASRVKEGVTLSTIGFGTGNYKDETMEQLANRGNGNNYYIDNLSAARKVFGDQLGATLEVVAKDAKLQIDFDPELVARYRLLGYENRDVADRDFRNDAVDAGEIGAGHQVTALYELELTERGKQSRAPLAIVRTRHKAPSGDTAIESAFPMAAAPAASFDAASSDFRFAFAVAAFADILRGSTDGEHWSLATVRDLAQATAGDRDDRRELVGLIEKAMSLKSKSIAQ